MFATHLRKPLLIAGGICSVPAGVAAFERATAHLGPKVQPQFTYLPCTGGSEACNRVFPLFHGMQGGPDQFLPITDYLRSQAHVLLAIDGTNVHATPRAAVSALQEFALAELQIIPIGLSLGTHKVVQLIRLLKNKVQGAVLMSGPATPSDVIWPHWLVRETTRLLHGGQVSKLIWQRINLKALADIEAKLRAGTITPDQAAARILEVTRCLKEISAGTITSSAQLLRRGIRLKQGEFAGIPALAIDRLGDHRARFHLDHWQVGFPDIERAHIPVAGHADLGTCPESYIDAIDTWLMKLPGQLVAAA